MADISLSLRELVALAKLLRSSCYSHEDILEKVEKGIKKDEATNLREVELLKKIGYHAQQLSYKIDCLFDR